MQSSIFSTLFSMRFLVTAVRLATPIVFAAMGTFIAASSGIGNIAIESIMTFSALAGVLGSYLSGSAWVGVLAGIAIGIVTVLLIAFFSMKMGANAMLIMIALNTFADSVAIFVMFLMTGEKGTTASLTTPILGSWDIPVIKDIPILGEIISGQYVLTYVCWLIVILLFIFIYKTPLGMRMRACGLNADAARTAGINVEKLRVLSLILSGIFASLGGIYLSLNYLKIFSRGMVSGQGWMGVAANGIAAGNYWVLILSALIFAVFRSVSIIFSSNSAIPTDLVNAIPYIAVFVILTVVSIVNYYRIKRGNVEEQ
ncbi:MAG: ABC transporter permease [Erysipelotrichaceae bacterium]|nr:ABC transporter permease [Erysipelotrichaceae bacterium]